MFKSTGTTISDATTAAIVPKIRETPRPPKTASPARSVEARMIATAVRKIGFARVALEYAIASALCIPFSCIRDFVKSMSSSEFLELIPIRAIKPMSEVAVRKNVSAVKISIIQCPIMTPMIDKNDPRRIILLKI